MADFTWTPKKAYTSNVEFKTIIDEVQSGREQRRNQWTNPLRRWKLEFDTTKTDREAIANFFIARKGKYEAFNWVWPANLGGDGQTYLVRFASDTLDFNVMQLGYSSFTIELQQVFN